MRRSLRRPAIALVSLLALVPGAACSSPATTSTTGGTGDYADLEGILEGSGSSFQQQFIDEVISAIEGVSGLQVSYGGGGSGKGKTDLQGGLVQYAGTDSLVKEDEKAKYTGGPLLYFPTVAAPITVAYHLEGVDRLQLSPPTLAAIFQRDVKTWDAEPIKADNPGVTLPATPITVVHRSDGSGTTETFTKYLKAAAPTWKQGSGSTITWPSDAQAAAQNGGVAQAVKGTDGAIGYVDFADATLGQLKMAAIKNKAGQYVAPSLEASSAGLAGAQVNPDLTYNALDAAGDGAYPIVASTYILVYQKQPSSKGKALKGFLTFILNEGQDLAPDVNYAKLPGDLRTRAIAQLDQLQIG